MTRDTRSDAIRKEFAKSILSTCTPEKCGWGPRSVEEWDRVFKEKVGGYQAFLQNWLYFGTICTVLGLGSIDIERFRQPSNNSEIWLLDSSQLLKLAEKWLSEAT